MDYRKDIMTFLELIERKQRLERELCSNMQRKLDAFTAETCVSPTAIHVVLVPSADGLAMEVGEVHVEVAI